MPRQFLTTDVYIHFNRHNDPVKTVSLTRQLEVIYESPPFGMILEDVVPRCAGKRPAVLMTDGGSNALR